MYNYKAQELLKELRAQNLEDIFTISTIRTSDAFRCEYSENGVSMDMVIVIEEGDWIMLRYLIAKVNNPLKKERLHELLNILNNERKLKYYINENDVIVSEFFLKSDDYSFDANDTLQLAIAFLRGIENQDYAKIMRVLWN